MPTEARHNFLGGVYSGFSEDVLGPTQVVKAKNCRITPYGAIAKRFSTRKIATNPLNNGFQRAFGLYFWTTPGGTKEFLVLDASLDKLWTLEANFASDFVDQGSVGSVSSLNSFAEFPVSGTNNVFFVTDGNLHRWDGTTLTTSISGTPSDMRQIAVYKNRLFATTADSEVLYWSAVGDATEWSSSNGAGSSPVGGIGRAPLTGIAPVGSSLAIFKADSIARYTGVTEDEINIDAGTEGISPDVGTTEPKTIAPFRNSLFFWSRHGPYVATEAGVTYIGEPIEGELEAPSGDFVFAVHNQYRSEIIMHKTTTWWVWNYLFNVWVGPWELPTSGSPNSAFASDATPFIWRTGGEEYVSCAMLIDDGVGNGEGGEVIHLDDFKDLDRWDLTAQDQDPTGAWEIEVEIEWPSFHFGAPDFVKVAPGPHWIHADLGVSGVLTVETSSEMLSTQTMTISSTGSGVDVYSFRPVWRGRRLKLILKEETEWPFELHGIDVSARVGRRAS